MEGQDKGETPDSPAPTDATAPVRELSRPWSPHSPAPSSAPLRAALLRGAHTRTRRAQSRASLFHREHPRRRADVQTDLPTQKATGAGWVGKADADGPDAAVCVTAVDGSDGLRPSTDGHLASIRRTGTPAPNPWGQRLCGRGSPLCGRWGLVTGAGLPAAGGGGWNPCPAVALRGLHSGFTSIWVTERLASSGEASTFSSVQWEHRPYRADTAALHGQSSSRTCEDTPHVLWEDASSPFRGL